MRASFRDRFANDKTGNFSANHIVEAEPLGISNS
jgi:hypothetical protein